MDEESIWYMMDEIGSAIRHNDKPNLAVHPFIYTPKGKLDDGAITYSICWPLENIEIGEDLSRDFLHGITEEKFRSSRLTVWFDTPEAYFMKQLELFNVRYHIKDSNLFIEH